MGLFIFFCTRQSLRIHYFVGFGSAFTKAPPVGGYGYAVILDDDLRIVTRPSSRLNILEKPLFFFFFCEVVQFGTAAFRFDLIRPGTSKLLHKGAESLQVCVLTNQAHTGCLTSCLRTPIS